MTQPSSFFDNKTMTSELERNNVTDSTSTSIWFISEELMFYFRAIDFSIICLIIDLTGVTTNIMNIFVFWRSGFKDSMNLSLFALAISDFGSCFSLIWMTIAMNPWFRQLDLPFESDEVQYLLSAWPHVAFTKITTLITAFIIFERCLCVAMPLKVKTLFTPKRVKRSLIFCYLLIAILMVPIFYCNRLAWKFYAEFNKTMVGLVYTDDREAIETVIFPILNAFLSVFAFIFITVCTILLVINLQKKSKWRQTATTKSTTNDVSSKEQKIAKMVVIISSLFIVCFFPTVVMQTIMMVERNVAIDGKYSSLNKVLASFTFTLESLNSSMNIFIYYHNSSNYKAMFDQIFRSQKQIKKRSTNT